MLRSCTIVLFMIFSSVHVFGQQNDWPISPKHKKRLERIKNEEKRARLLAKFIEKDSAKFRRSDSAQINDADGSVWKEELTDKVTSKTGRLDSARLKNEARKTAEKLKENVVDQYDIPELKADSATVQEAKSDLKRMAKDSLENIIDIPDIPLDSSAVETVKSTVKATGVKQIEEELDITIPDVRMDSTLVDQAKSEIKSRGKALAQDQLGVEIPSVKLDSTFKDEAKSEIKSRGRQAIQDELGTDIPDIKFDSTTMDQLGKEAEKRALEAIKNEGGDLGALGDIPSDSELGKLSDMKQQLEKTQQELKQGLAKQKIKEKMAASAKRFIQDNAGQISKVQSQMGELKKKYSYVPNSNDLSTAKKRTSLEGENVWKRLVIGGNFNVSKTNPLRVDLSPVIGYKINKLFEIGVTGAYRTQFNADKNGVTQNGEEAVGFSVFADHMVFKNFFGHLEGEQLRTNGGTPENPTQEWNQTLLLGIGRKFNVAKWLEMQALVLYNPLHDNTDGIYNSPVVFKTALRVRK